MATTNQVDEKDCQKNRTSCVSLIDQKLKNAIISLKLWIALSVLVFLMSSGGTLICTVHNAGRLEEKVETLSKKTDALDVQLESLRQEIWNFIKENKNASNQSNYLPGNTLAATDIPRP